MNQLDPDGIWVRTIQELREEHLVTPSKNMQPSNTKTPASQPMSVLMPADRSKGERSWIWDVRVGFQASDSNANDDHLIDRVLRVEWAKSKALMDRWVEEVALVNEEMRRVQVYLQWRSNWWPTVGSEFDGEKSKKDKGIIAYSKKQAAIMKNLANSFRRMWLPYAADGTLQDFRSSEQDVSNRHFIVIN